MTDPKLLVNAGDAVGTPCEGGFIRYVVPEAGLVVTKWTYMPLATLREYVRELERREREIANASTARGPQRAGVRVQVNGNGRR